MAAKQSPFSKSVVSQTAFNSGFPANGIAIGGSYGGNLVPATMDGSGNLNVNVAACVSGVQQTIFSYPTTQALTRKGVSISSATNTSIWAASGSTTVRVYRLRLRIGAANVLTFTSNSGGTALSEAFTFTGEAWLILDMDGEMLFDPTTAGHGLFLNTTTTGTVIGSLFGSQS